MFGLLWFYTTAGWLWWGSAQHSRTVVLFEILILRVKNVKWDWEKTPFRQYVLVNSQESYIFVSAVCQCIFNVCLGCSWFFLSTHRWQEALTVYPRTNKQNQKKKRKVDPPTQQVTIGSPILNNDFFFFFFKLQVSWQELEDQDNLAQKHMFLFVSNDAGFLNRKVSQLAFCCFYFILLLFWKYSPCITDSVSLGFSQQNRLPTFQLQQLK